MRRIWIVLLAALVALTTIGPARAQEPGESEAFKQARALLGKLTPEERVGQLFLVTFQNADALANPEIRDLLERYHVGGVVLRASNNNFVAAPETIPAAQRLIGDLQQIEWDYSIQPRDSEVPHTYIPLFIGLAQEGGGYPNDQILEGLTQMPDQMAIGATWQPALAQEAGQVMGRELSALGANLYMGLSLDVHTSPRLSLGSDLSTRVFGGDPYWVGVMGKSFISGIKSGSEGRMAVVSIHFPGRGESDRATEEEVATVRKTLEELKQIELAPFFAVTNGNPASAPGVTDAMLISHIRYQGFQGNIRAATKPVSLDQQALGLILSLPPLNSWRTAGGLTISDDLGTAAVRRFYAPGNQEFSARIVARDAFLAGNDLLYMGNILSSNTPNTSETVIRAVEFFSQKYREDPAFAQRVDESALRILALKFRMYPQFDINRVRPSNVALEQVGQSKELPFSIARQAATLISPSAQDFSLILPEPPGLRDNIIFFTDTRTEKQCSTCPEIPIMAVSALQTAVQRLYGPATGGLITPSRLSSYSLTDLSLYMNGSLPDSNLTNSLQRANWVVFSVLDLSENRPETLIFRRFLSENPQTLLNKRVILFSFSAPYYLDATNISKLSAFYGLYSESSPFVEVAARLLFQELTPVGASPVSIPGMGYDLITATSPNPTQVISLSLDLPPAPPALPTLPPPNTPEPIPAPLFRVGDTISLRTGIILDRNNHQVPDGTVVRFSLTQSESGLSQQVETTTEKGVARASFQLDQPGLVEMRAVSEPATISDVIQLTVSNEGAPVIIVAPTTEATATLPASPTPEITPTPTPQSPLVAEGYPTLSGWLVVMALIAAFGSLTYWMSSQINGPRWAFRYALLALMGGLSAYNYLVLDLPGASQWLSGRGLPAFLQASLIGLGLGLAIAVGWQLTSERNNQTD